MHARVSPLQGGVLSPNSEQYYPTEKNDHDTQMVFANQNKGCQVHREYRGFGEGTWKSRNKKYCKRVSEILYLLVCLFL